MSEVDEKLLNCPACQIIDAADGQADGRFFSPPAVHVKNENHVTRALARTQDRAADRVTAFAGSLRVVYLHPVWFGIWVALNIGLLSSALVFDEFPFGLLTMIVSLEAIFLSTFVMVSQNRADEKRKVLADHQWELVQHEEQQNEELLQLSQNILNLTSEVHQLTVATTVRQESP